MYQVRVYRTIGPLVKLNCIASKTTKTVQKTFTPRATRYAELGGSRNSEVNKGNRTRQGSVLFVF